MAEACFVYDEYLYFWSRFFIVTYVDYRGMAFPFLGNMQRVWTANQEYKRNGALLDLALVCEVANFIPFMLNMEPYRHRSQDNQDQNA